MNRARVCGVVLGAGRSLRLGQPKQTLPLGDTTLLGWVVRAIEASSLDRVIVVVGGSADEARAGVAPGRASVVTNDAYGTGCASSLLAGLEAAGDCDAVMLCLGDMPSVDGPVIDAVRSDWELHRPWAAVTSYRGQLGHPFVFSADAFGALRELHGDKAVWTIVDAHTPGTGPELVRRVAVDRPLPLDVDTWDDYMEVCHSLGLHAAARG